MILSNRLYASTHFKPLHTNKRTNVLCKICHLEWFGNLWSSFDGIALMTKCCKRRTKSSEYNFTWLFYRWMIWHLNVIYYYFEIHWNNICWTFNCKPYFLSDFDGCYNSDEIIFWQKSSFLAVAVFVRNSKWNRKKHVHFSQSSEVI